MRSMRRPVIAGVLAASAFAVLQTTSSGSQPAREYVVVYERGVSAAKGQDAVKDAGGQGRQRQLEDRRRHGAVGQRGLRR